MLHNTIQISFGDLSPQELFVVTSTINTANRHGFPVHLKATDKVEYDTDSGVDGFFMDVPEKLLAVAVGKSKHEWLATFLHESCHLDQWIDQDPTWTDLYIQGIDTVELVFLWVNNHIELNDVQRIKYIGNALKMEVDCERRTVAKINQNNFDYNIPTYIQQANSYLYSYLMMSLNRKWFTISPYDVEEVWKQMPTSLDNDYTVLPQYMKKLYEQYCYT